MKKYVDFLLVLPLLLAVVFIFIASRTGSLSSWFSNNPKATDTLAPTVILPARTNAAVFGSTVLPYPTSTGTAPPVPTATRTVTATSAPTFIVVPPPTRTSTSTRTSTPPPTATTTATPTDTPLVTATATAVSQEMLQGIAAGNQVVRAIENYYLNQGKYPAAVTDLIPTYLPGLPVTPTAQPYVYRYFPSDHPMALEKYWLSFRVAEQEHLTCTYMRRIEYWDCNYSSP